MNNTLRSVFALGFVLALTFAAPCASAFQSIVFGNAALTATTVQLIPAPQTGSTVTVNYWNMSNPNAALVYIQFFDVAATTSVTLGTTAPTFYVAVPAFGGVVDTSFVTGFVFKNGVVVACTTTPTGNTAPTSACTITVKLLAP
jgi:hypothetical protein